MAKPVLEIDGAQFDDLDGFYREFSGRVLSGAQMGHNLDALDDVLHGGFGTPEGGFIVRWRDSDRSRQALGYAETLRFFEQVLKKCDPSNVDDVIERLDAARQNRGSTLFDMIVEVISDHGPGGKQAEGGVDLDLA